MKTSNPESERDRELDALMRALEPALPAPREQLEARILGAYRRRFRQRRLIHLAAAAVVLIAGLLAMMPLRDGGRTLSNQAAMRERRALQTRLARLERDLLSQRAAALADVMAARVVIADPVLPTRSEEEFALSPSVENLVQRAMGAGLDRHAALGLVRVGFVDRLGQHHADSRERRERYEELVELYGNGLTALVERRIAALSH